MKYIKKFESFDIIHKIKNAKWIKRLNSLDLNNVDEVVDFLEDISPFIHSNTAQLDLLRREVKEGVFRANLKFLITRLKKYLNDGNLEDIRMYGPFGNELENITGTGRLNGWLISNIPLSFH